MTDDTCVQTQMISRPVPRRLLAARATVLLDGVMTTASGRGGASDGSRPASEHMADLMVLIARDQDRRAFGVLFGYFAPRVKGFLMRRGLDAGRAEEITQETLLIVWRKADRFDRRQASVSTWIFTIARNRSIDALRRERRPGIDPDDPTLTGDGMVASAETAYSDRQDHARLKAAIATLPDDQAHLLKLAFFEDKSHSAIAETEDLPLGTVKSRLRLAVSKLRVALAQTLGPVQ